MLLTHAIEVPNWPAAQGDVFQCVHRLLAGLRERFPHILPHVCCFLSASRFGLSQGELMELLADADLPSAEAAIDEDIRALSHGHLDVDQQLDLLLVELRPYLICREVASTQPLTYRWRHAAAFEAVCFQRYGDISSCSRRACKTSLVELFSERTATGGQVHARCGGRGVLFGGPF